MAACVPVATAPNRPEPSGVTCTWPGGQKHSHRVPALVPREAPFPLQPLEAACAPGLLSPPLLLWSRLLIRPSPGTLTVTLGPPGCPG